MSTNALVIHVEMKECVKMALEYFVAFVDLVTQVSHVLTALKHNFVLKSCNLLDV